MKNIIIKIQSVSDIITNSSSEVFMVYNNESFKDIKELVNAILNINKDNKYTFDDLFEIKAVLDEEYFLDSYPEYEGMTDDELLEKARRIDEDKYEGYPFVCGYEVTAKKTENEEVAGILSKIDRIFETYVSYC